MSKQPKIENVIIVRAANLDEKINLVRDLMQTEHQGKLFKAVNVKKDGTLRSYSARMEVNVGKVGGKSTTAHKANLITIYDMTKAIEAAREERKALELGEVIEIDKRFYRAFDMGTCRNLVFNRDGVLDTYIFIDEWSTTEETKVLDESASKLADTLKTIARV